MTVSCVRGSGGHRRPDFELALFELSGRFDGVHAPKWRTDKMKLISGCRDRLKELVKHDWETVRNLRVVGVLHAGGFLLPLYSPSKR